MRQWLTVSLLTLAACQNAGSGNKTSDSMVANVPAPVTNGSSGPTSARGTENSPIVGRWGDNNQCDAVSEFFGNGTFRASNGNRGHWRLEGDRLTIVSVSGTTVVLVRTLTSDRLIIEDSNGNIGESMRC